MKTIVVAGALLLSMPARQLVAGEIFSPDAGVYEPPPFDPYAAAVEPEPSAGGGDAIYRYALDTEVTYDDAVADAYDDGYDPDAYFEFQDTLSPYGSWIDDPTFGRVWIPAESEVGADFTPYATNGYWDDGPYGWTWVSGWSWGWAPFHYGRWLWLPAGSWCWVPGTVWGPAWVAWRAGGDYVGWAPLPPRGVTVGRPIGRGSRWRFVLAGDLGRRDPRYVPRAQIPRIFGGTHVVASRRAVAIRGTSVRVNGGPSSIRGAPPLRGTARGQGTRQASPQLAPAPAIRPRLGTPLARRPWLAARPPTFAASAVESAGSGGRTDERFRRGGWSPRRADAVPLRAPILPRSWSAAPAPTSAPAPAWSGRTFAAPAGTSAAAPAWRGRSFSAPSAPAASPAPAPTWTGGSFSAPSSALAPVITPVVPASPRHSFGSAPHHSAAPSFAPPSLPPARHPSAAAAASAPLPSHSGGVAPARPAFHPGVGAGGGARGHFGRGR